MPRKKQQPDDIDRIPMRKVTPPGETEIIAIDPGDQHVGVAFFARDEDGKWYCQDAQQIDDPDQFEMDLAATLMEAEHPVTVVYEIFRLYVDKAKLQQGSEFRTSQGIGVIKFVVRARQQHRELHDNRTTEMLSCELPGGQCADKPDGPPKIDIVGQRADIKKPAAGILRTKGIQSVGKAAKRENKGWGDHCVDAELHGWYHILKTLGGDYAP